MAETSAIEWTDSTWNPVTGCTRVSPGCAHCYIETTIPFRTKHRKFERVGNEEKTDLQLHSERLDPKKVPKGPRIFVNSLSDLFHEEIPASLVDDVFQVMALLPDRTFQVLTKRPEYARDLLAGGAISTSLPLPNVWLGVSIENARYTWRADVLREIPAAVRFISAEPLLGSLFASKPLTEDEASRRLELLPLDSHMPRLSEPMDEWSDRMRVELADVKPLDLTGIDWLIVGGESGGRFARPMHPDWARELRDACLSACQDCGGYGFIQAHHPQCTGQCSEYGCPVPEDCDCRRPAFFFKQWGSWTPTGQQVAYNHAAIRYDHTLPPTIVADMRYAGAGPKSGGNELDGRVWQEFPHVAEGPP